MVLPVPWMSDPISIDTVSRIPCNPQTTLAITVELTAEPNSNTISNLTSRIRSQQKVRFAKPEFPTLPKHYIILFDGFEHDESSEPKSQTAQLNEQ